MTYSDRSSSSASRRPAAPPVRSAHRRAGFSLIEIMTVMALITLVTGFVVPAVKGLVGGNTVDAGAAKLSGLLNLARSEAIARHTIVRFVVATDWPEAGAEGNLRRVSLWAWDADSGRYLALDKWEELPAGLILETGMPDYVRTSGYAQADAATVRGSCVLQEDFSGDATFAAETNLGTISTRFIEFNPSGSARIPGSSDRQAIFVATQGYADASNHITHTAQANGRTANWAQVNVDTLTGRAQVYRP